MEVNIVHLEPALPEPLCEPGHGLALRTDGLRVSDIRCVNLTLSLFPGSRDV